MSTTSPHKVIRASAGTGKTFRLSNHYLSLVHRDVPVDQILATTFTRKAAGEILDRIVLRLAEATRSDAKRQELGQFLGDAKISRQRCIELLARITRQLHRIRVSTLDSFFAQVARSLALELSLSPSWEIADELEDTRLRNEAIDAVLQQHQQQEKQQDLLRLMHLLTKGTADRSVSELLRGTVSELYSLFEESLEEAWKQVPRGKPLSDEQFSATLEDLRTLSVPNGAQWNKARDGDYNKALLGQWEELISAGLAGAVAAGDGTYYRKPIESPLLDVYERLVAHARAMLMLKIANQTEGTWQWLDKFDAEYHRLKRQRSKLRFDDVTRRLALLGDAGGAAELAFRMDGHIEHLLLDEFQDTSPPQWRAIRPLAQRVTSGAGRTFFCVGDVKQAIYGWRGGVAEIFDTVEKELSLATSESLVRSFRSSPPVIEAVNTIFSRLTHHPNLDRAQGAIARWQKNFERHSTARDGLAGYVTLETAPEASETESQDEATLGAAVAKVREIAENSPNLTVGLLVRTNQAVAQLIYLLRKAGIAASEEGGNPLTDSAAVRVVLSLLKLADHPGDTISHFHLACSPLGEHFELTKDLKKGSACRAARQVRAKLLAEGYGPTLFSWAKLLAPSCNRRELSRLEQLVELGYSYETSATLRTSDFLRMVESQRVSDPTADKVRVMTVHQAKGLEFDVVILPDLDFDLTGQLPSFAVSRPDPAGPVETVCRYVNIDMQKMLPPKMQLMFQETVDREVTETMCVLYVALTRAVHALHMIIPPSKPNEKSFPRKAHGLLRSALYNTDAVPPSKILWSHGDANWQLKLCDGSKNATAKPMQKSESVTPLEVKLAPPLAHSMRDLERLAPSRLHASRIKVAEHLVEDENVFAKARGTVFHALFEAIEWLDAGLPSDSALRRAAARDAVGVIELGPLLREFLDTVKRGAIRHTLSRQQYENLAELGFSKKLAQELTDKTLRLKLRREFPFAHREEGKLLTGTIDRLVLLYDETTDKLLAADILDFKTDANVQGAADRHREQMHAYRAAVSRMLRLSLDRIATRLIMVKDGSIVKV